MNDPTADARLSALLQDEPLPQNDRQFVEKVVELAAHDLRLRRARTEAISEVGWEAVGLLSVIALFVLLARVGPPAGMGDELPANSPALLGILLLLLVGVVGGRGGLAASR